MARLASAVGRLVLWIVFALFLDMAIGGVIGSLTGEPPGSTKDLQMALTMSVIAAGCAGIIWVGVVRKNRGGNRVTIVAELRDILTATLSKLPKWILITVAMVLLVFIITGVVVDIAGSRPMPPEASISSTAAAAAMLLWMAQLTAACIYAMIQGFRHRVSRRTGL